MGYLEDIVDLSEKVEELNKRIELLTPASLLKAARKPDEEVNQIPLKVSRTVDWRTKKLELEKKYSKEGLRDNIVKEISSPAELFDDK